MRVKTHPHGFTLIALVIALSLFAILLGLAGPIAADFMGTSQVCNECATTLPALSIAPPPARGPPPLPAPPRPT